MNTAPESGNGNSRILIVDDNSAFTHHVSEFLQNTHRYVVCEENDPCRALETARIFHPDLILLDLIMPKPTALKWRHRSNPTGCCTASRSFS